MNCRFASEMIALWVGNDLTQAESEAVSGHVDECPDCQRHVEALMHSADVLDSFKVATLRTKRDSVWPNLEAQLSGSGDESAAGYSQSRSRSMFRSLGMFAVAAVTFLIAILPDYVRQQPAVHDAPSSVSVSGVSVGAASQDAMPQGIKRPLPADLTPVYLDPSWEILQELANDPVQWHHPRRRGSL